MALSQQIPWFSFLMEPFHPLSFSFLLLTFQKIADHLFRATSLSLGLSGISPQRKQVSATGMQAALLKSQDARLGQARCCVWAPGSSHTDKSFFEGACPYWFQLQVLDKSGMCLKPKPKLTPKIQTLVNWEAKKYALGFWEAKIMKGKGSQTISLMTSQTCTRTVNIMVKGEASYRLRETSWPLLKVNPDRKHRSVQPGGLQVCSQRRDSSLRCHSTYIYTVTAHLLLRGCEQN